VAGIFPGIDPFLESQGFWADFHATFLNDCRDALFDHLPDDYEARIEETFQLFETPRERPETVQPDLAVLRRRDAGAPAKPLAGPSLMEPVSVPIAMRAITSKKRRWIEIRRRPGRMLVTVIELLSPAHKTGRGYLEYHQKRLQTLAQPVHLVELVLIAGGKRLLMDEELPEGDFYALVSRVERRPNCDVYAWSVRQPLPLIPIPLKGPDRDIPLDLASVYATSYERGRYARWVDYSVALKVRLYPEDRQWAEKLATTQ
jgi:hypothetical protein